jgi:Flp pilus assembly protein TadD
LFERALTLDDRNVEAWCGLATAHGLLGFNWVTDQPGEHFSAGETAALRALELAPDNARAHFALGRILLGADRGEEAVGEFEHALALDRNMPQVPGAIAMAMRFLGRPEEAEAHARVAMQMSPRDPRISAWTFQIGAAALQLGQFEKAASWLRRSVEADRTSSQKLFFLAAALAHLDLRDEARAAAATGLAIDPGFKIRRMVYGTPSRKPKFLEQWQIVLDGMRKAGLPE